MMSDPAITLARDALLARLRTIRVANGYRCNVAAARSGRVAQVGDERDAFPALNLFSLDERASGDTIGNVQQQRQDLTRAFQLEALLFDGADYEDQWDALLEDIRRALSQPVLDPSPLGGLAVNLLVRTVEFNHPAPGSKYPTFSLSLMLSYRLDLE